MANVFISVTNDFRLRNEHKIFFESTIILKAEVDVIVLCT